MRTVKNITVAVSPELYRKTRMLAVEYDTTVTTLVTYLLSEMPRALHFARYPAPGTQSASSPPQSADKTPRRKYHQSPRIQRSETKTAFPPSKPA